MTTEISDELAEKLPFIRICKDCKKLGRSILWWKSKKCKICNKPTKRWKFVPSKTVDAEGVPAVIGSLEEKKILDLIVKRTADFNCPGEIAGIVKGPVVTEYMFSPERFTRVGRLKSLNEDLALALAVDNVSIRRIPGQSKIGIAIPNGERLDVSFDTCKQNTIDHANDMEIPLNFGIMSDGSPYVEDLSQYPHLLMAGATGTGKSVLLNQLICNLLLVRSPKQLQFILIDPKTVELFPYKNIPHLLREPVSSVWRVIDVLADTAKMMKSRTEVLHDYNVHSIKELNAQFKAKADAFRKDGKFEWAQEQMSKCWPYIMVIIDELSEIVIEEKKEFIAKMASISQMARAAGISVIAATQRPSVDVLPGKVKVNFLARASFRMPTPQDSKTVLTVKGAETLLGKGDMFVLSPDKTGLQRIHTAFCQKENRDEILKRIVDCGYDDQTGLLKDYDPKQKILQEKLPARK